MAIHSPVFLPGKFHVQRSLAGYRLWTWKESDATEDNNSDKPLFCFWLLPVVPVMWQRGLQNEARPATVWKVLLRAGALLWSFILSFRGHCPVHLKHPPTLLDSQLTNQRDTKRSRGSRQKQVTTSVCWEWLPPKRTSGRLCVLVVSHSGCSRSNSSFTLATCLRWATLLSLWAYSPAYKMGVTHVLISIKSGDT